MELKLCFKDFIRDLVKNFSELLYEIFAEEVNRNHRSQLVVDVVNNLIRSELSAEPRVRFEK